MAQPILEVRDLHTHFFTREGVVKALNGVSFTLHQGQILGLVGESGAGKTVTALSILRLVPYPGRIVQGEVLFKGQNLLSMSNEEVRRIRGREIATVFQDAQAALNPTLTVGSQVEEVLLAHTQMSKKQARGVAAELFHHMGLPDPKHVLDQYPFQISGGMAQRVMLAMALALEPEILIADEPTSNLDVTLQADILLRLRALQRERSASILLITHDLGVIAQMAEDVAVMYAGSLVEYAETKALFRHPSHPYTWGLFQALPRVDNPTATLHPMRGSPPNLVDLPEQCPFLPRCPKATNICRLNPKPPLQEKEQGHQAACYNEVRYEWAK
ncbi:MAG: ABC transporter ATP-binding protein [Chloroflexi bacterium]|nr:ABC transporter ATP-binding protein [Chloroflexota bacterium]